MPFKREKLPIFLLGLILLVGNGVILLWPHDDMTILDVVGPEVPGTYKHASSACELASGEILLAYYSGSGEYGNDTAIFGTQLNRSTNRWSPPRVIADAEGKAEGNPALWRSPKGDIWLFYPVRQGETWSTATLSAKVSTDDGRTWENADTPNDQPGLMTRARPITLSNGGCLLPLDFNPSTDTEFVSEESGSLFCLSDASLETWEKTEIIPSRLGNHQPAVAAVDDEYLIAYCRRGGDYLGREDGFLVRTESHDGGHTWSPGKETAFPNPNSPVDFVRLQSGNLLLAYNKSSFHRSLLSVALSTDHGQSFPHRQDIISGEKAYSYPCILQTQDGTIHLFFTAGARSHIKYAILSEEDLLAN
ncbi:MAG: exo-alpha-sialidase [Planctomycetaceae bacterium]|nr:exo-alpha-sialidase [Planctomycetaceae bacterium]